TDDVVAACNDPVAQRFLPMLPSPYTAADAHRYRSEQVPAVFASGGMAFVIADGPTDRVAGMIGITRTGPTPATSATGWRRGRAGARWPPRRPGRCRRGP